MAEEVLLFERELPEVAAVGEDEDRVVAETALPFRRRRDRAFEDALALEVAAAGEHDHGDAAELGRGGAVLERTECVQERLAELGAARAFAGEALGADPGLAAERLDLEPGVLPSAGIWLSSSPICALARAFSR